MSATRYKIWIGHDKPCAGKFIRGVCTFGFEDLRMLVNSPKLFANKFFIEETPVLYDCIEEMLNKRSTLLSVNHLDIPFYEQLPFVKDHF